MNSSRAEATDRIRTDQALIQGKTGRDKHPPDKGRHNEGGQRQAGGRRQVGGEAKRDHQQDEQGIPPVGGGNAGCAGRRRLREQAVLSGHERLPLLSYTRL